MSGANVDKAQQVRPAIAVYAYSVTTPIVIALPGVPGNIGGAAPGGAHGLLLNFLTIQNASVGDPTDQALKYFLSGDPSTTMADYPANVNTEVYPDVPSPVSGQFAVLPPGEQVRFDLSYLYDHALTPALAPIQYLHVESVNGGAPAVNMRFWRSSGR
ncbi:MAG: hypothetical protein GY772_02590 [bacterium]|nr:hypothetical protein [bacterium]MCP4436646.1 hypothetical protein [Actinomycetes bacterium]